MVDELDKRANSGDRWFLASPRERVRQRITPNYWFGPGPTITAPRR